MEPPSDLTANVHNLTYDKNKILLDELKFKDDFAVLMGKKENF